MRTIAFLTIFVVLVAMVNSHPSYFKVSEDNLHGVVDVNGEIGVNNPLFRGHTKLSVDDFEGNLYDGGDNNGELEAFIPKLRGVRAVCEDAFCAKQCRLDRKPGGRCWGSVCVCNRA